MEIKINFNNKAEAHKQVKLIQKTINDLLEICQDQKKQLLENISVIDESKLQITNLTKSAVDLSDAIKNIQRLLGSKMDLLKGDEELMKLTESLNTFIVSSGAIKLGVISNEMNKNE